MPKITKRVVDSLKSDPNGKDVFVWDSGDGSLKGFGIRIKPSGAASYLVQYRNKHGRTRRLAISKVGVLTPEQARAEANEKLRIVAKGGDPSAERHADRTAMTVEELCRLYQEDTKKKIKPSTHEANEGRIKRHVIPLLGGKPVKSLALRDIERFQADIAAGKTAKKGKVGGKRTNGHSIASRTVGMLGTIFEFAKRHGIILENPAKGVRKFPDEKKQRFLSMKELHALGKALNEAEAMGENKTAIAAIRALFLTGCRRNEVLSLPKKWVDLDACCIRFGDTKSGAQVRPVGKCVIELLSPLVQEGDAMWVFPSERGEGHLVGLPRILKRYYKKAKIEDASIHTSRHTFSAVAAELGYSVLTIAGIIGHAVPGVTARYAHVPDRALLSAADRVSLEISDALSGRKDERKVVSFRSASKRP